MVPDTFAELAAELDALQHRVADACCRHEGPRGSDLQAYRNFIALAEFANPETMPPLKRRLDGTRAEWCPRSYPPLGARWTPPRGVPVIRTPVRGIPRQRAPRSVDD